MERWKRNLYVLWLGSFVTSAGYSMVIPFLPLFLVQMNVKDHVEIWSGLLFSVAPMAGAFSSPIWGAFADKYGRKPMIIRAGIFLVLIYILTAFVTNPYELLVLRVMQGLLTGYIPWTIALIGSNTPQNQVGYALAMISTATATGGVTGPLLGGVISHFFNPRIAFASAGVMVAFSTMLVVFWVVEENFVAAKKRSSIIQTMGLAFQNRAFSRVMLITILTAASIMTIEPVLPLYIVQLGGSADRASLLAGIVFSLTGIAGMLFAPRWGRLADKKGFFLVLSIGLLGGGLGNLAQIPFNSIWGFSIVRFIYGAFFCAVYPAINGLVVQTTSNEFRGRAFGLNQTANQVGMMLGPLLGGWVGAVFSIHSVFWITGFMLLATMLLVRVSLKEQASAGGEARPNTMESAH